MTKQVSDSKQPFPENIRKSLEGFWEPITSANYCGDLVTEDGGKLVRVPTFVVNKTHYVYVHNAEKGLYQLEAIARRQERQKKFGEQARCLMKDYGFTWELGKLIVNEFPKGGIVRRNLCEKIQEAKEYVSNNTWSKKEFDQVPKETILKVIYMFDLNYWLNTRNPKIYNVLKNYLFAVN